MTTVCVVEIFTTDGINFSAKSAKEFGADLTVFKNIKLVNTNNIRNFLNSELNRRKLELSSSIINELLNKSKDKLALSNYLDKAESLIRSDNKNVKIIEDLAQERKQEVFNETYELINHIKGVCHVYIDNEADLKKKLIYFKRIPKINISCIYYWINN